jgi:opacity protein-like surface antigen
MLRKLLIGGMVLAASSTIAFAQANYKGDYKGEMPCPGFVAAPYVGFSIGNRVNWSGVSQVFDGLDFNLSAGYAAMMSPEFYLAGEIFAIGTATLKDYAVAANASSKSNWSYGLSILPGMLITNDLLGYLRGGVTRTHFNSVGENSTGWHIGAGLQTNIMDNLDLRAEYIWTSYNSISGINHVQSNQANLGLVYKFL